VIAEKNRGAANKSARMACRYDFDGSWYERGLKMALELGAAVIGITNIADYLPVLGLLPC
jgi:hypothetical protein